MRELRTRSSGAKYYTGTRLRIVTSAGGVQTPSTATVSLVIPASQTITDKKWIGPYDSKVTPVNPLRFNYVSNIKLSEDAYYAGQYYSKVIRNNGITYEYWYDYSYLRAIFSAPVFPTPPSITEKSLRDGFLKLQPSFKDAKVNGINIYTAVLELADLKKTFTKSTWALKKTFADIPEKHLAINFGVLPLFGDIQAIYHIVTRLSAYIDAWNLAARNGMVWDKHVALYKEDDTFVDLHRYVGSFSRPVEQWYENGVAKISSSGKAHLYFSPKEIKDADRKKVYVNALGLAEPLEGIWEAVPFSWAIDYFFRVGDIIAAWDEALPTMFTYNFVDAGYSYKSEVEANLTYDMEIVPSKDTRYTSLSEEHSIPWSYKHSIYKRIPVSFSGMIDMMERPADYSAGWNRGAKQLSYLASVAYLMSAKR
jgi:hypothetical protein